MEKQLIPKLRFPEFKDKWNVKQIDKILTIGSGKDYKHLPHGEIPVYGSGGFMTLVDDFLYEGESVCIGRKGTIDKPIFLNEKFWTVDTLFYTHSFIGVKPNFVFALFQNINWYKYNEASGVPSLSKTTIGKIKISIPNLSEQQKIASFLTDVDDKITKLTKKKSLLEQYKKGVMQKIFNQELRFKDENGSEFSNWEEKKLEEVGNIVTGSTPSTTNPEYYNGCIHFVSPSDIQSNRYITKTKSTISELGFSKSRKIQKGSVLFVCIGSTIGKVAQTIQDCATNQQINAIIPNKDNDSGFIYSLLEFMGARIKLLAGTQAVPQINKTDFSNIRLNFPCLKEQAKIGNFLSDLDLKIEVVNSKIENTRTFKKGLLQQMFV